MADSSCPRCGAAIEEAEHPEDSLEDSIECPECARPLTWLAAEPAGGRWIVDEDAEARRRMEEGPGEVDSPAPT